jgi:hypothetical protein
MGHKQPITSHQPGGTKMKRKSKGYYSEPVPTVYDLPDGCFKGTQGDFEKLSPGMRLEILRDWKRRNKN